MKFGGSSLAAAAEIERVTGIVRDRLEHRPLVVVSAMAKTTRALLAIGDAAAQGDFDRADDLADELRTFHEQVGFAVVAEEEHEALDDAFARHFADLAAVLGEIEAAGEVTPRLADAVVSFGELLSSEIFALALRRVGVPAEWLDCRDVLATDSAFTRAAPLEEETAERLARVVAPIVERGAVPVVGGYVGATLDGVTTTLGREGSDFSAAIFGAALGAREIQIWTDVPGILSADPRLFPDARRVATLSFAEALELARSGSKKPHPGTLGPTARRNVPIRILSSLEPEGAEERSTVIGRRADAPPTVKSIACRRNSHLLRVHPIAGDLETLRPAVLAAIERVRPALLPLGDEDGGIALALDRDDRLAEVLAALPREVRIEILPGRETVSLISEDLTADSDLTARTLAAADGLAPRLVAIDGSCPAVRLLTAEADVRDVVARLHAALLPDGAGFA